MRHPLSNLADSFSRAPVSGTFALACAATAVVCFWHRQLDTGLLFLILGKLWADGAERRA